MPIVFTEDNRFDGVQFAFQFPDFAVPEAAVIEFELLVNYAVDPIATTLVRFRGS